MSYKLLISVLLLSLKFCFAQGSWTKIGDMPEIRFSHTVEELNGKIYVIGGANKENSSLPADMLVYDELLNEWSKIPMMNNEGRWGHASCVVNGKLFVLGGNSISKTTEKKMWMYDPETEIWELKNEMFMVRALFDCAVLENKIYVMGGTYENSGDYNIVGSNELESYDIYTDTWTQLANMPSIRWGHSASAVNNKIYVFGGVTFGSKSSVYKSVEVYNPETNIWITKSNMPTARYSITSCLIKNEVFIIGGWLHSNTGPIYDKVEIYNTENDVWRTEVSLPVSRAISASVAIRDTIYVYGGAKTTHPNLGSSEIHRFIFFDIFPQNYCIDKKYAKVGADSVLFRTNFSNIHDYQFTPSLIYRNENDIVKDSLLLFDDGINGDSLANDGVYGRYIHPQYNEDFYTLDLNISDHSNNKHYYTKNVCKFTTAGPITWKEYVMEHHGDSLYSMKVTLKNQGSLYTVKNISAKLTTNDSNITEILTSGYNPQSFPDIKAGESVQDNGLYGYVFYTKNNPESVKFSLNIYSDNICFWTDSLTVNLITKIKNEYPNTDILFLLLQNYPNPFNPVTTIKYSIPLEVKSEKSKVKNVTLKVFDVLGSEIETLVNEKQKPGNYEIVWNANQYPSGIYFYRLVADAYADTKKMILLK